MISKNSITIGTVFLLVCAIFTLGLRKVRTSNVKEEKIQIRYYGGFHNDNSYLYSYKNEFEFLMNEELAKKGTGRYYKVYFGPDGKYYKAEMNIPKKNIQGTYLFDDNERQIYYEDEEGIVRIWCYEKELQVEVVLEFGELKEYIENRYIGDKLMSRTKYEPVPVVRESMEYDHEKMKYKLYDELGNFVKEYKMAIGK